MCCSRRLKPFLIVWRNHILLVNVRVSSIPVLSAKGLRGMSDIVYDFRQSRQLAVNSRFCRTPIVRMSRNLLIIINNLYKNCCIVILYLSHKY